MDAGEPTRETTPDSHYAAAGRTVLALTFLLVLAAVSVSAGLVAYTAWKGNLANGIFAILFAVLSSKAALDWLVWSRQPFNARPADSPTNPQDRASRKPPN